MVESVKKRGWVAYGVAVAGLHGVGIIGLILSIRDHPALLGLGFLAYTLGLRHAFDADHIAAIDNTVRKLIQQGQNTAGVGFFFSLGHATVVCVMALLTSVAARWAEKAIPQLKDAGSIIGTSVSGSFLLLLGVFNLFILIKIFQVFWQMRKGEYDERELEELLHARGLMARLLHPLMRFISKSWHVYPVGFLFGLGFDTASEISLIALSAGAGQSGIPWAGILALPLLFAAGMSLLDTADGMFMTTAYDWAFRTPLRKVYYNMTVTGLAVVAALFIGLMELAQVISSQLGLRDGLWKWLQDLDLGSLGYVLVILFVLTWAFSYGAWKIFHIEERWSR